MGKYEYFCTSPLVASEIINRGYESTRVPNPWQIDKMAWKFSLDKNLAVYIYDDFTKRGKKIPKIVTIYLERECGINMGASDNG